MSVDILSFEENCLGERHDSLWLIIYVCSATRFFKSRVASLTAKVWIVPELLGSHATGEFHPAVPVPAEVISANSEPLRFSPSLIVQLVSARSCLIS